MVKFKSNRYFIDAALGMYEKLETVITYQKQFKLNTIYTGQPFEMYLSHFLTVIPLGLNKTNFIEHFQAKTVIQDRICLALNHSLKQPFKKGARLDNLSSYLYECVQKIYHFKNGKVQRVGLENIQDIQKNSLKEPISMLSFGAQACLIMKNEWLLPTLYVMFTSFEDNTPFKWRGKIYSGKQIRLYLRSTDLLYLDLCVNRSSKINANFDQILTSSENNTFFEKYEDIIFDNN